MTSNNDKYVCAPSPMHPAQESNGAAGRGLKRLYTAAATSVLAASLMMAPLQAQNLDLSVDQLIERIGEMADGAGETLEFKELSCVENDNPANPDEKIVSCTHMLGEGRLLISNAQPEGPLLDIATQPWDGGENGPGAMMIAWIAAAINDGDPSEYGPMANALVSTTAAEGMGDASIGQVSFFVIDMDSKLTITAQAN